MKEFIQLSINAPYPLRTPVYEGSAAQFFTKQGFTLQVMLPSPISSEIKNLRDGKIRAGFIRQESQILILFKIGDMILECPFMPQIIPNEEYATPELTESSRLFIEMHVIDTSSKTLKAIRGFTLNPKLTKELTLCVNDIRKSNFISLSPDLLYREPLNKLIKKTEMHLCGSTNS